MKAVASILCACALALPAAALGDSAYPGEYSGKAKGASLTVSVSKDLEATARYAIKTECGKAKGTIDLGAARNGAFAGKRVSRGPQGTIRTTVIKLRPVAGGEGLAATAADSLKGGESKLSGCNAKRKLTADLGKTQALVISRDAGHYVGASADGRPISFDLVGAPGGRATLENLSVDTVADCVDDLDPDAFEFPSTVHLAGLAGAVKPDGSFYISQAPDEETDNEAYGEVGGGVATLEVAVSGLFGRDGLLSSLGPLSCDSWGEVYEAARVG